MRLISVNVGLPRAVVWHGRTVTTGIFKAPVDGRVAVRQLNLDGDRQADLSVHGGPDKAIYCYPIEHYAFWRAQIADVPIAAFGENFTTEGLAEDSICVGDEIAVGSIRAVVTQPRMPCYKLGVRFQADDMVKRFLASGRSGFYLKVARQGEVAAGDEIAIVAREPQRVSIAEITRLHVAKRYSDEDVAAVRRALQVTSLPDGWTEYFRERLEKIRAGSPQ